MMRYTACMCIILVSCSATYADRLELSATYVAASGDATLQAVPAFGASISQYPFWDITGFYDFNGAADYKTSADTIAITGTNYIVQIGVSLSAWSVGDEDLIIRVYHRRNYVYSDVLLEPWTLLAKNDPGYDGGGAGTIDQHFSRRLQYPTSEYNRYWLQLQVEIENINPAAPRTVLWNMPRVRFGSDPEPTPTFTPTIPIPTPTDAPTPYITPTAGSLPAPFPIISVTDDFTFSFASLDPEDETSSYPNNATAALYASDIYGQFEYTNDSTWGSYIIKGAQNYDKPLADWYVDDPTVPRYYENSMFGIFYLYGRVRMVARTASAIDFSDSAEAVATFVMMTQTPTTAPTPIPTPPVTPIAGSMPVPFPIVSVTDDYTFSFASLDPDDEIASYPNNATATSYAEAVYGTFEYTNDPTWGSYTISGTQNYDKILTDWYVGVPAVPRYYEKILSGDFYRYGRIRMAARTASATDYLDSAQAVVVFEMMTQTPTDIPTPIPTPTLTPANTPTNTFTPLPNPNTPTPTDTPIDTPVPTATDTPAPTPTVSPTNTGVPTLIPLVSYPNVEGFHVDWVDENTLIVDEYWFYSWTYPEETPIAIDSATPWAPIANGGTLPYATGELHLTVWANYTPPLTPTPQGAWTYLSYLPYVMPDDTLFGHGTPKLLEDLELNRGESGDPTWLKLTSYGWADGYEVMTGPYPWYARVPTKTPTQTPTSIPTPTPTASPTPPHGSVFFKDYYDRLGSLIPNATS